jgi:hypothetical protein
LIIERIDRSLYNNKNRNNDFENMKGSVYAYIYIDKSETVYRVHCDDHNN